MTFTPLTSAFVQEFVPEKPGVYCLKKDNDDREVCYVGRSDNSLKKRLNDWIGTYNSVDIQVANSAIDAYNRECILYHKYGKNHILDNENHPDKVEGDHTPCPVCNI